MRDFIANRAVGIGLVTVMTAPFILVVAAVIILGKAAIDVGGVYVPHIAGIARSVNDEIAPRLEDLRQSYQDVATGIQRFQGDARQALARLGNLPDLTVRRGQLGATPALRVVVPNRNYKIASSELAPDGFYRADFQLAQFGGSPLNSNPFKRPPSVPSPAASLPSIELGYGSLFNQTLPSQAIPPRDLSLSSEPIRAALGPVSDGFGEAIGAIQRPIDEAIQQTSEITQPLAAVGDDILAIAGPMRQLGQALALAAVLLAAALLIFVIAHVIAAVVITARRPVDAGTALLVSGPLGYVAYVGKCVRQEACLRLIGHRKPLPSVHGDGAFALNEAA